MCQIPTGLGLLLKMRNEGINFEIQTRDILESLIIVWGFHDIWNNQDQGIEVQITLTKTVIIMDITKTKII